MIFNDLKAIFIHVERTGGVALRKYLLKYEKNFERPDPTTKHLTARQIEQVIDEYRWRVYWKFAFVRNPYDRLVSWYLAIHKHKGEWKSELDLHVLSCKTFEEFIKNPHPKVLITQFEKVIGCDMYFKFEEYNEEVKDVARALKIPYEYRKENESKEFDYRDYYTPELRRIVEERYKKDLEFFKYEY